MPKKIALKEVIKKIRKPVPGPSKLIESKKAYSRKKLKKELQEIMKEETGEKG